jgi:membrane-associated phospholipid phosphatase
MLDITDLVCPALRTPFFESFMTAVGYYGHSATGFVIGAALLGHGHVYQNDRTKSAGTTLLIVVILAIGLAEALKHGLQQLDTRSHFTPSGRTGTAFGLASVLSVSFPALSPFVFGLAILAAISRLYWHAQYIWNVLGGALVGLAVGWPVAKKLLPRGNSVASSLVGLVGWMSAVTLGLGALAFFYYAESNIAAHLVTANNISVQDSTITNFDFGTSQARTSLRYGWSGDESWNGGKRSVVWATGLASELVMKLPTQQDYRFRLNALPNSPKGPACQGIEVRMNGLVVAKVFLEPGWHWYEFDVPKTAIDNNSNYVQFFYDYAETPKSRGKSSDDRLLSVAFDSLQALPKR